MDTLSWPTLTSHIEAAIPFILPMGGTRGARLACNPEYNELHLQLPTDALPQQTLSPFAEMTVVQRKIQNGNYLEITVNNRELFSAFHQLSVLATIAFEKEGILASQAFEEAIENWQALLLRRPLLSDIAQQGLLGELIVLHALIEQHGAEAVNMWVAYSLDISSRHDYRVDQIEIEVKTTRRRRRVHQINGLTQLLASPGCLLYVLSLQFEAAGPSSGMSLSEAIEKTRALLPAASISRKSFEDKIARAKFRDEDAPHYKQRFKSASLARLIEVNDDFPRITQSALKTVIPSLIFSRIDHVTYEVDLEGLGVDSSSPKFHSVFRGAAIE